MELLNARTKIPVYHIKALVKLRLELILDHPDVFIDFSNVQHTERVSSVTKLNFNSICKFAE